jgi:hypothetical protein
MIMTPRICLTLGLLCTKLFALEPIDSSKFDELFDLIQPSTEERAWQAIPWGTKLWDARIEAARLGKPIYLWEMDGNPLGCT